MKLCGFLLRVMDLLRYLQKLAIEADSESSVDRIIGMGLAAVYTASSQIGNLEFQDIRLKLTVSLHHQLHAIRPLDESLPNFERIQSHAEQSNEQLQQYQSHTCTLRVRQLIETSVFSRKQANSALNIAITYSIFSSEESYVSSNVTDIAILLALDESNSVDVKHASGQRHMIQVLKIKEDKLQDIYDRTVIFLDDLEEYKLSVSAPVLQSTESTSTTDLPTNAKTRKILRTRIAPMKEAELKSTFHIFNSQKHCT